jgi:hypothetical protein
MRYTFLTLSLAIFFLKCNEPIETPITNTEKKLITLGIRK